MGVRSRQGNSIKITVKNDTPESRQLLGMFARAEQKVNVLRYLEDEGEYNRMVAGDVIQSIATALLQEGNFDTYLRESGNVLPDFFRKGDFSYDEFITKDCHIVTNQSAMRKMSLVADVIEDYIQSEFANRNPDSPRDLIRELLRDPHEIDELTALRLEKMRENAGAYFESFNAYLIDNITVLDSQMEKLPANPDDWKFNDIVQLSKALRNAHWGSEDSPVDYKNNPLILDFTTDSQMQLPFDSLTAWMGLHTEYTYNHQFKPADKSLSYSLKMAFNRNFRKQEKEKDRQKYYTDFVKGFHEDVQEYRTFMAAEQKKTLLLEKTMDDPNNYPYSRSLMGSFVKINNHAYVDAQNILRETLADLKINLGSVDAVQLLKDDNVRDRFYARLLRTTFHEYHHYQIYNKMNASLPPLQQQKFMTMFGAADKYYRTLENEVKDAGSLSKETMEKLPSSYAATSFAEFYAESFAYWYSAVVQNDESLMETYRSNWSAEMFRAIGA